METIKLSNGFTVEIIQDEMLENPQQMWDNVGHCEFFHREYNFGNENMFSDFEEAQKYAKNKNVIALPVYMCDHSGITINTTGFSCGWDSGQIGYIWVTKESVRDQFNVKRITEKLKEKVLVYLQENIETLDQYLRGQVWLSIVGYKR